MPAERIFHFYKVDSIPMDEHHHSTSAAATGAMAKCEIYWE